MEKQEEAVVVTDMKRYFTLMIVLSIAGALHGQESQQKDTVKLYKKRVLSAVEIDLLSSYYSQTGNNAAVSGGVGTEDLTDVTPTIVVAIPINEDDVLTIDAGISAYTSASSSNVDPFDRRTAADPFQASSGESSSDTWANVSGSYSHSSDDRNKIWSAKVSVSAEYDYTSVGFGGGFTKLWNEKNTELSISANVFLDQWSTIYPVELRTFGQNGSGIQGNSVLRCITGNQNNNHVFIDFQN